MRTDVLLAVVGLIGSLLSGAGYAAWRQAKTTANKTAADITLEALRELRVQQAETAKQVAEASDRAEAAEREAHMCSMRTAALEEDLRAAMRYIQAEQEWHDSPLDGITRPSIPWRLRNRYGQTQDAETK